MEVFHQFVHCVKIQHGLINYLKLYITWPSSFHSCNKYPHYMATGMDQAMSDSNWYTASCNPQRPSESPQVHQEQKLLESITRQTEKWPCLSLKPSGRKRSIFTLPPKRSNIGTKLFPHQLQSFSPCWSGVWVSGGWSKLNLWSGVKWIGEDLILSISHSGHLVFVSGWTKARSSTSSSLMGILVWMPGLDDEDKKCQTCVLLTMHVKVPQAVANWRTLWEVSLPALEKKKKEIFPVTSQYH